MRDYAELEREAGELLVEVSRLRLQNRRLRKALEECQGLLYETHKKTVDALMRDNFIGTD